MAAFALPVIFATHEDALGELLERLAVASDVPSATEGGGGKAGAASEWGVVSFSREQEGLWSSCLLCSKGDDCEHNTMHISHTLPSLSLTPPVCLFRAAVNHTQHSACLQLLYSRLIIVVYNNIDTLTIYLPPPLQSASFAPPAASVAWTPSLPPATATAWTPRF